MQKILITILFFLTINNITFAQDIKIALLKYNGGGDWYANPTSLPNLIKFCNKNLNTNIADENATVTADDPQIFNYPFIHITGHGNIIFSKSETENLRKYLIAGGFLHISDNYGLDKYIRREMKKIFPELDFIELPYSFAIYHQKYNFNKGLPKIHKHNGKPAQGFGIIYKGRLVVFYDYECDLGDGWEDITVHNDTQEKHLQALKMGANIIEYVFNQDK